MTGAVGAIGARFSPDGYTTYVASATGLGFYDVSQRRLRGA